MDMILHMVSKYIGIVRVPVRKQAHAQLVREPSATVVSVR